MPTEGLPGTGLSIPYVADKIVTLLRPEGAAMLKSIRDIQLYKRFESCILSECAVNMLHSSTAVSFHDGFVAVLASEGIGGVGKSIAMLQTVVEARRCGWLVLYIPEGEC